MLTITDTELTKNDYQRALEAFNACNLCGVVQSYAGVMKKILNNSDSTDEANSHPIAQAYALAVLWISCTDMPQDSDTYSRVKNEIDKRIAEFT